MSATSIEFLSDGPTDGEFLRRLRQDLRDATLVRFALGYASKDGVGQLLSVLRPPLEHPESFGVCSLSCACGHEPLVEIWKALSTRAQSEGRIRYFMESGPTPPGEPSFVHTKLIFMVLRDRPEDAEESTRAVVYIGSHNWSRRAFALGPVSAEASLRVEVDFRRSDLEGGIGDSRFGAEINRHLLTCFTYRSSIPIADSTIPNFEQWRQANCKDLQAELDLYSVALGVRSGRLVLPATESAGEPGRGRTGREAAGGEEPDSPVVDPASTGDRATPAEGDAIYMQCHEESEGKEVFDLRRWLLLLVWNSRQDLADGNQPTLVVCRPPTALTSGSTSEKAGTAASRWQAFSYVLWDPQQNARAQGAGSPGSRLDVVNTLGQSVRYFELAATAPTTATTDVDRTAKPKYQAYLQVVAVRSPSPDGRPSDGHWTPELVPLGDRNSRVEYEAWRFLLSGVPQRSPEFERAWCDGPGRGQARKALRRESQQLLPAVEQSLLQAPAPFEHREDQSFDWQARVREMLAEWDRVFGARAATRRRSVPTASPDDARVRGYRLLSNLNLLSGAATAQGKPARWEDNDRTIELYADAPDTEEDDAARVVERLRAARTWKTDALKSVLGIAPDPKAPPGGPGPGDDPGRPDSEDDRETAVGTSSSRPADFLAEFDRAFQWLLARSESATDSELDAGTEQRRSEGHWDEDPRFRRTPWGRLVPGTRYLANDDIAANLKRADSATVGVDDALAELSRNVGRRAVICGGDPRFDPLALKEGKLRLVETIGASHPWIEDVANDARYLTHLPLLTLRAAAASEPAGEWGAAAEPQHIEEQGWLRVQLPRRRLNRRMFVAKVVGHSMDAAGRGLHDGQLAVFQFLFEKGTGYYPSHAVPIVLVRGEFSDPETGAYAVKRLEWHDDGAHLVSLNPDRDRFPDIVVPPEDDGTVRVVAELVRGLEPGQYATGPEVAGDGGP